MVTGCGLEVHRMHPSLQGLRLEAAVPLQASKQGRAAQQSCSQRCVAARQQQLEPCEY